MLKRLDGWTPAWLAVPTGALVAGGLVALGLWRPVAGLIGGAALLVLAGVLAVSAQWQVAGSPTAHGVERAPQGQRRRWIGWLLVALGVGVLIGGVADLGRADRRGASPSGSPTHALPDQPQPQ